MGDVRGIGIGGNAAPPEEKRGLQLDNAYSEQMEPYVADMLYGLGASEELRDITSQHIRDLHITGDSSLMSRLDVRLVPSEGRRLPDSMRIAVFSTQQLRRYQKHIVEKFEEKKVLANLCRGIAPTIRLGQDEPDRMQTANVTAKELAFEWMFFELCADALGNSYYMSQTFGGRYVPDFNGQSQGYGTENAISRQYLKEHPEAASVADSNPALDHASTRAGFALLLLRDSFIRRGIFETVEQAEDMIGYLAERYPYLRKPDSDGAMTQPFVVPHKRGAIQDRLEAVHQVRSIDGRVVLAEVVQLVFGDDKE